MTKKLNIFLAGPRGFCAGVDRAIEMVKGALKKYGTPVYVRHEIVHNKFVVENLKSQGAIFVEELNEIEDRSRPVIFSAHGVPKAVPEEALSLNLIYYDATCPLVSKIHKEVENFDNSDISNQKELIHHYISKESLSFSATSLSLYESCPLAYKYKMLDRLKVEGYSPEAAFGVFVHNIFEKIFSIEFKYNRLVLLPGDYFYDVAYDSTKETNCRFTLETGYTDMVTHSKNEQSKEEYYE